MEWTTYVIYPDSDIIETTWWFGVDEAYVLDHVRARRTDVAPLSVELHAGIQPRR